VKGKDKKVKITESKKEPCPLFVGGGETDAVAEGLIIRNGGMLGIQIYLDRARGP